MENYGVSPSAADVEQAEVAIILEVLKRVPGCTCVSESRYNGNDINRYDVHATVKTEDRPRGMLIRRSASIAFDTKLKMARELRRRVAELVGESLVDEVEARVRADVADAQLGVGGPAMGKEDVAWLHEWVDSHESPWLITESMANEALAKHVAGKRSFIHVMTIELLHAQIRAAERRRDCATNHVSRLQDSLRRAKRDITECNSTDDPGTSVSELPDKFVCVFV